MVKNTRITKYKQTDLLNIKITHETVGDYEAIKKINDLAFGQEDEGRLVEKLRKKNDFIPELSSIAKINKKPVGHILFYPVYIRSKKTNHISLSLGPMAVLPDFQKKGIGKKLVQNGLARAKRLGFRSVIVVGHPNYYPKFGFQLASTWGIEAPFEVPDNAFMAIELEKDALKNINGTVIYPPEFNAAL